ncbi:MAG: NAD-dependent epimerase/dehydratase family protein [Dehalococcoidia bacterium]|nr:NAD-dependent epimerase/dehydratase family protein [Dehalococcoidia bacterium]
MKIFITGGTGFIGTHLVERLAHTEHQTYCLVRDPSRAKRLQELGAKLMHGDVTDKASVMRAMKGCDWVFNLANIYTFWVPDKRAYHRINVEGTRNVMQCALDLGVSKVVHLSTYGIWAKSGKSTFNEDSPIPSDQVSEYCRSKYEGDRIAWEYYEKHGLQLTMIHPGNVLGEGDNKPTGQFLGDIVRGKQPVNAFAGTVFTFVHVRDVVEAVIRAAEKPNSVGQRYIVANQQLPWGELAAMAAEISGASLPRFTLPGPLALATGATLTLLANITKKPPLWGLSFDAAKTLTASLKADGSKAQRELGITYTPIRLAVEETVASCMAGTVREDVRAEGRAKAQAS